MQFPMSASADTSTLSVPPRAWISTPDGLFPGMGAVVRVAIDRIADGIVVPTSALFRKGGRTVAYVRHGSKFEETPIEVSRRSGDQALVAKGLQPGEQLALKDPTLAQ